VGQVRRELTTCRFPTSRSLRSSTSGQRYRGSSDGVAVCPRVRLCTSIFLWHVGPGGDRLVYRSRVGRVLGGERHDVVVRSAILRSDTPPPARVPNHTSRHQNLEDRIVGLV